MSALPRSANALRTLLFLLERIMNTNDFSTFSAQCFRDRTPPCTHACPLGLDVRSLIEKIQRGNFTSAYRVYRNHTLFPAIVSRICPQPCKNACVRRGHDEAVLLKMLEAACVTLTKDTAPIQYNVPKKNFSIAVIGAGLSGLSCALKLASRNYRVIVYETAGRPGGRLSAVLPPEIVLGELELQFAAVEYELRLSTRIASLDDVVADAVYIATGANGADFGLLASVDANALGTARNGVFLGGGLLGADPVRSIEHGVRASHSIEKFLKVGAMDGMPETFTQPALHEAFYSLPVTRMPAAIHDADTPSKEEAVAESKRCLRCNCSECRDNCELMQHFLAYPTKITADITSSLNVIERLTERVAQRLVNSCTLCGLCKKVCPVGVDMERCIMEARRLLHKNGSLPKAFHDFWLRDMDHANSAGRLLHLPQGEGNSSLLFFPGCQLGASDPAYVLKTYASLCEKHPDTALLLACCGIPAEWDGDEERRDSVLHSLRADWARAGSPRIILGCPSCRKTFARCFPESDQVSLYEFLAGDCPEPALQLADEPVFIYDPCSSAEDPMMRQSVRLLAQKAGLRLAEEDGASAHARCCGFGGNIYAANPELANAIVSRRINAHPAEYITYCTNCRDIFSSAGKPSRHILDVLFTRNPSDRKPPSLSQRRANRLILKGHFADNQDIAGPCRQGDGDDMRLTIAPELVLKMDRELILEEDVKATIRHCEESGEKVLDTSTGLYSGHLRIGIITYWVTYGSDAAGFVLHNAYAHRMAIDE